MRTRTPRVADVVARVTSRRFLTPALLVAALVAIVIGIFYALPGKAVVGDFAVYREGAALETITTTPAKLDFSTSVSEGSGFSMGGGNQDVTLSEAGHYLALYNLPMETISGTNRSEIQGRLDLSGWDLPYGLSTCYIRRTEGVDECWMAGAAIIESTSTSQTIAVEAFKTDSNSAGVRRRANESGFMLVRLDDDWDFARIREVGGGQTFNTTSWTTVSWDTNDELDAIFSRTGGDITLSETGHYLVTYTLMFRNSGGARRNNETRLTLDGFELPGTRVSAYTRTTNATDDHAASFVGIIEATTTDQILRLQGVCEGEACGNITGVGNQMGITIAKLPETAEYVRLGYSADDQLTDVANDPFEWDIQSEIDAASFSHDSGTNPSRVEIDQAGDYLFLASFFTDRTSTGDGSRQQPRWEWRTNGSTVQQYGSFAKYNRGDQSTTGTFSAGASGGIVLDGLTTSDYIEVLATNEATGVDPQSFYDSPRLGIQGVRLGSLITPDVVVGTVGAQVATSSVPALNTHVGATFVIDAAKEDETINSIRITENGTVDAANGLDNVRLYYENDTSSPYNCASESYNGTENQYGATSTFPAANGSITFSESVAAGTSSPLCVYVVLDVTEDARDGETIEIEITDPDSEVTISEGLVGPEDTPVLLGGTTTLVDDEITQTHYHWRNDDGSETLATSATGGIEDTILSSISAGTRKRVRLQVSNEGSATSSATGARLEYALRSSTCDAATGWAAVDAVGGAWDMSDSPFLTNGQSTTDIPVGDGGTTNENTDFITPNGAIRDTDGETGSAQFSPLNFAEVEYSIAPTASAVDGATYCFRMTNGGTPYANYDVYAQATIAADVTVSATGTQTVSADAGEADVYMGGVFAITEGTATRTVTSLRITETGTVDAQSNLSNVRLYYELDTSAPYTCASESYNGTETQYGATSTFASPNGTSTFSGSVAIATSSAMCVYTVLDVGAGAGADETIEIEISAPGLGDVAVSSGSVNPNTAVAITGSTTIRKAVLEQKHYHWRNDDGTQAGASSATDGNEDTNITQVVRGDAQRLRFGISNEGSTTSTSTIFALEYGEKITTCSAVSWQSIGAGGDWTLSDSPNLTDGANTTDIAESVGGVTDENTVFLTPNGGVRDDSASTSALTLLSTNYVDLEYSIEATPQSDFGSTYCFRITQNGAAMDVYDSYPQATIRNNQDFYIQRGDFSLSGTSTTITAGVDYVKPSASTSAFIRITNSQHTGAGRSLLGGTQTPDTVSVWIENPWNIEDSVTFVRHGTTLDTYVAWEIVEYTGAVGGDNEILVHAAETTTITGANTTASISVSGVSDGNDVVPFITGQAADTTSNGNFDHQLATTEWDDLNSEVDLTRIGNGSDATWSVAVVEFTGANWKIQRAEHTYSASGVWETEPITTVNDIDRAFLHVQKRTSNPGLDEHGHEIYLLDASTVRFQLQSGAATANQVSVAYVIENTQTNGKPMMVHRSSGSQAGGVEPHISTVSMGTSTRDITTTSIFLNNKTTGTGTAYPRAMIGAKMMDTSSYQIWVSDTGQTRTYRTEVVDWPTAELTLTQNYYLFFVDNDLLDPTDIWPAGAASVGENTPITGLDEPPANGDRVRIRMTVNVSGSNLSKETAAFKLQYGVRSTACTAITEWTDLADTGSTTAVWRGYNAAPLDGSALGSNPPLGGELNISVSDRAGTFEEQNNTVLNPFKVFMGEDVEFDWVVQANDVSDLTSYCFRMTEDDGSPLHDYVYYPTITTVGFELLQWDWQWYDDELSVTPGTALAASNTAPSNIAYQEALKLRVLVSEGAGRDGDNAKFKLQVSEFSDFSTVADVADLDTCTTGDAWCYFDGAGVDNATITSAVLDGADACVAGVGDGCGTHNESSYVPDVVGEVGTTSTDNAGTTVTLAHTYDDPVFIVEAIEGDDTGGSGDPAVAITAVAIITATTTSSFTVRVQEPDNEADDHGSETIAYIVMERGAYQLPDGRRVDVNSKSTSNYYGNAVAGASDDTCTFTQTFTDTPVVLTALQSDNNTGTPDFLTTSQALVTANDFACSIEVPDGETNSPGSAEEYGWIAIEGGSFTNNGIGILATTTSQSVTGWTDTPWYEESFPYLFFTDVPLLLGNKQTRNGAEGGWLRWDSINADSARLGMDERDDGERTHTSEVVGYLAASGSGVIYRGGDSGFTFTGGTTKEFEFTLQHNNARPNQTYFFRLYDVYRAIEIAATSTRTYPSLSTEGAQLTFSISGIATGSTTEGIVTDVTTTATSVPFGSLSLGVDKKAAQRITVSTNATQGYQILAFEDQDLTAGGATISDVTGTNASPSAWATGCTGGASSCFGYHAGDNTLEGGNMRFLMNDTYAALTGTMAEVAYSSGPVTSEQTDIIYRIQVGATQPAGIYENNITYVAVPVF